ncbi:hypothetical protein [Gemmatimonas sp.]|uniref:hypothetical protein n=1 Tax=Gemmatimonas sp. TaxID=1962908 RepID=UPI003983C1C5
MSTIPMKLVGAERREIGVGTGVAVRWYVHDEFREEVESNLKHTLVTGAADRNRADS